MKIAPKLIIFSEIVVTFLGLGTNVESLFNSAYAWKTNYLISK